MRLAAAGFVIVFASSAITPSAAPPPAEVPNVLVQYSFDDGLTDTGPDTFAVFQNASGQVRLSSRLHYSGYRSIELHDVAGDRNFPELQGYFPERKEGQLFFHFAMLVVNPDQGFNIALAGPEHFTLSPNGIAFWLKAREGILQHVSDSIPKRLFKLEAFTWYLVDLRYDIPRGVYDLAIRREGEKEPLTILTEQPNAANAPGSSVDKFSFVGSVYEDDSNVTFYVDDVAIGTDEKLTLGRFVAPGRRKLFIDRWKEARELLARSPSCPPVLGLSDFGLRDGDMAVLEKEGKLALLQRYLNRSDDLVEEDLSPGSRQVLAPIVAWRSGCAAMTLEPSAAAKTFADGARRFPSAPIFALSEVLALLRARQTETAMRRWVELEPLLQNDPRYGMIAAAAGLAAGDLTAAEQWLSRRSDEMNAELAKGEVLRFWDQGGAAATEGMRAALPETWETHWRARLVANEYYNVLLWKGQFRQASAFAERMAAVLQSSGGAADWIERSGDGLLLAGAPIEARAAYERVLALDPVSYGATTKLSDVYFLLGDTAHEKLYREKTYGTLTE
jgi:tetratricopeptide (TPR) repeat protein